jgi:hypothetical protein
MSYKWQKYYLIIILYVGCRSQQSSRVIQFGFDEFQMELTCNQTFVKHPLKELAFEMYLPWQETFPVAEQSCLQLSDSSNNYSILLFYGTYYGEHSSVLDSLTELAIKATHSISMSGVPKIERDISSPHVITYWTPNWDHSKNIDMGTVLAFYVIDEKHFLKLTIHNKIVPEREREHFILEAKAVVNSVKWKRQT